MEKDDIERMYWFTVMDSAELLAHADVSIDTFLGDVYNAVHKLKPSSGNISGLLAILDQLSQERIRLDAEAVKNEVFKT